jgi:hypothetical protein
VRVVRQDLVMTDAHPATPSVVALAEAGVEVVLA